MNSAEHKLGDALRHLVNIKLAPSSFTIKLPTGAKTSITHVGDNELQNGLKMPNVRMSLNPFIISCLFIR